MRYAAKGAQGGRAALSGKQARMEVWALKRRAVLYTLGVFALTACGGGGGSGTGGGGFGPPATPTPTPPVTTRQGTVVDDASDAPLSGVNVRLDPWIAYPTPGPTPTPILTTSTDSSGHFVLANVPNGTYLLVIGADAVYTPPPGYSTPAPNATDTPVPGASNFQATVHDRVVLGGGGTVAAPLPLVAPTMLPEPNYTPPASETGGNYRLLTIDARTDAPCYLGYNLLRAANGQHAVVLDEWSSENGRAVATAGMNPASAGQVLNFINTGNGLVSGGANCSNTLADFFAPGSAKLTWDTSTENLWFGGTYIPFSSQNSGFGGYLFPNDPRLFADPNNLVWP